LTPLLHSETSTLGKGLNASAARPFPTSESPPRTSPNLRTDLQVADITDLLTWGWDGQRLSENLMALDFGTTDALTLAHEGNPDQWGPVFMNHPDTWRLLVAQPGAIVGYWHIVPLLPGAYRLVKAGQLLDSQITVDAIPDHKRPGVYDVYFVQVCLQAAYRTPGTVQLLFQTIFDVLTALADDGIYVREVTANAYTRFGEALCRSFNLRPQCSHREHGTIYSGPISNVFRHVVVMQHPHLRCRYQQQELV
jgi:hypothetical protein